METLQDVIAALHANLQDLRSDRDSVRRLAAPSSAPQALRPGPAESLPVARPALVDRE
jgi:hypothetical protein